MKSYQFEHTSLISATQKELFGFHTDTHNLPLITPGHTRVEIEYLQLPLNLNSRIELRVKRMGVAIRWKLHIDAYEPDALIVDVADESPFESFRHEHHFIAQDAHMTLLHDRVSFSLPLDPLSRIIAPLILWDLKQMFAFRHQATQDFFEQR